MSTTRCGINTYALVSPLLSVLPSAPPSLCPAPHPRPSFSPLSSILGLYALLPPPRPSHPPSRPLLPSIFAERFVSRFSAECSLRDVSLIAAAVVKEKLWGIIEGAVIDFSFSDATGASFDVAASRRGFLSILERGTEVNVYRIIWVVIF